VVPQLPQFGSSRNRRRGASSTGTKGLTLRRSNCPQGSAARRSSSAKRDLILAVTLTPEAFSALLGAGVGVVGAWGLGAVTGWRAARRDRKIAALLVLTEIGRNLSALGALRSVGAALPPLREPRQTIWEANGRALLYGADLRRAGIIERAYSTVGEIGTLVDDPGRDFTTGDDAALADRALEEVFAALREVSRLAGLPRAEAERRIEAMRAMPPGG
jgi:hypothetical protein